MKNTKCKTTNYLVPFLFTIYIALLVWIILFKLQFSISELDSIRSINLIPFYYDNEINIAFHLNEVLKNVAIFIPFGIYLSVFENIPNFKRKLILISVTSLVLETAQYILAIGRSDITDLLTNISGGLIGICFYWFGLKLFRSKKRADFIITVVASIVTVLVLGVLFILLAAN